MKRLLILALMISSPAFAGDFNGRGATGNGSELSTFLGKHGGSWGAIAGGGSSSGCRSVCSQPIGGVELGHSDGRNYVRSDSARAAERAAGMRGLNAGCGRKGC